MRFRSLLPLLFTTLLIAGRTYSAAPCDEFVARLPNVKRALCESATLQPSAARSVKGRTLWIRDNFGKPKLAAQTRIN